jgi:PAS domain S-box-containing protein
MDNLAPAQVSFFADPQVKTFFYQHKSDGTLTHFDSAVETVLEYSGPACVEHFFEYQTDNPINTGVNETIKLSLQNQRQLPFEMEVYDKSGAVHRLAITMVPHYSESGDLIMVESVALDISSLHNSLSGYKRKSILLDEVENIARMGTWDWNMQTNKVRWSPALYTILQSSADLIEPGMQSYIQFLQDDESQQLSKLIVQSIKSHAVFEHSHRLFLNDGTVKYVESRGKALLNAQGEAIRMIGTVHDVTEQIEAQSQLEKVYRLINSSVNEIYIFERDTYQFSFVSEGACKSLGYSQLEMSRMTPFDLCPVIPRVQVMEMMSPVMEHNEDIVVLELTHLRKDGTTYPVEIHLQLMDKDGPPQFVAIALDNCPCTVNGLWALKRLCVGITFNWEHCYPINSYHWLRMPD